jgi:hypothetical protein
MYPSAKRSSFRADAEIAHIAIAINVQLQRSDTRMTSMAAEYWSARLSDVAQRHSLLLVQSRRVEALQHRLSASLERDRARDTGPNKIRSTGFASRQLDRLRWG